MRQLPHHACQHKLTPTQTMQEYLDKSRLQAERVEAFVELHIEQGPLLEQEGLDLGVVTHILGPSLIHVHFNGTGGHAGGMPMLYRCYFVL